MTTFKTLRVLLVLFAANSCPGASQLAPFYEAVAKDPYAVMDIDLFLVGGHHDPQ